MANLQPHLTVPPMATPRPRAQLRFFAGPMGAGKSTLALQLEHNYRAAGRWGLVLSCFDRAGSGQVTSRLGMSREALEVTAGLDLHTRLRGQLAAGDYLIADEAQFYSPAQIDQLARLVDEHGVDVDAFGLLTDFQSHLFPGSQRLLELADQFNRLQLEVLCWCGSPGSQNARVLDGQVTHHGAQVVVGDVAATSAPAAAAAEVRYVVLCRRHWRNRQLADGN